MEELSYRVGGLTFDVSSWGPDDGEVVVLLHGFPANRSSWRRVAPPVAAEGRRVLAPDQRGYAPGARPSRRRDYAIPRLVGDVLALADAVGAPRFHVVGHDWGGVVAWSLAAGHRDRVASLTVLSTPHPRAYAASLARSSQLARSWYVAFFQLPWLPEQATGGRANAWFRRALTASGLPDDFAEEYAAMMSAGAARYAINWYRAAALAPPAGMAPVEVPTLYVYSTGDVALTRTAADLTGRHVAGPYRYEVIEGSHWIPEEQPDTTARLVADHVRAHPA